MTKVFLWEDIVRSIPYEAKDFVPHKSLDELVRCVSDVALHTPLSSFSHCCPLAKLQLFSPLPNIPTRPDTQDAHVARSVTCTVPPFLDDGAFEAAVAHQFNSAQRVAVNGDVASISFPNHATAAQAHGRSLAVGGVRTMPNVLL